MLEFCAKSARNLNSEIMRIFKISIKNNIRRIYNYVCCINEYAPERTELPIGRSVDKSQILH